MTGLTTTQIRRMQSLIDRAAKAVSAAHAAISALDDFTADVYGATASDVDADQIIDAVLGGSGAAPGMTAAEFDQIMRGLTDRTDV